MSARLAASVALRIASGTSRALPWPKPPRPFWSPTTTRAAKPKRRPPFTTLATRLMWTSLSVNSLSRSSRSRRSRGSRAISLFLQSEDGRRSRDDGNPFMLDRLRRYLPPSSKIQAALAGGICECLDPAVIEIAAAIEHHILDALRRCARGKALPDRLGRFNVCAGLQGCAHLLLQRRSAGKRLAFAVVDNLRIKA